MFNKTNINNPSRDEKNYTTPVIVLSSFFVLILLLVHARDSTGASTLYSTGPSTTYTSIRETTLGLHLEGKSDLVPGLVKLSSVHKSGKRQSNPGSQTLLVA